MFRTITTSLVAILILGTASIARAESGTDAFLDNSRSGAVYQETLVSKPVALQAHTMSDWMDRASQVIDGGGF